MILAGRAAAPTAGRAPAMLAAAAAHVLAAVALLQAPSVRTALLPPALEVRLVETPAKPAPEVAPRPFPIRLASITSPLVDITPIVVEEPPPPAPPPPPIAQRAPTITPVSSPQRPAAPAPEATFQLPRVDMRYLDNPAPVYPLAARRAGEQGKVILRVHVLPDGSVDSIEVRTSSGHPRLDQAALQAVRRWRFLPARRGAVAVAGHALVPIDFEISRRG